MIMLDNIRYGLKDVYRNKVFFIITVFFLVLINIIAIITSISIRYDFYEKEQIETQEAIRFNAVPVGYDIQYDAKNLEDYMEIINKNAMTYRLSHSLSEKQGAPVFLVFGDSSVLNHEMDSSLYRDEVIVYTYDQSSTRELTVLGKNHTPNLISYEMHNENNFNDIDSHSIFVVYQGDNAYETINLLAQNEPYIFYELLSQTVIRIDDKVRIDAFMDFTNNDIKGFSFISPEIVEMDKYISSNHIFIRHYLVPLYVVLLLLGIFSFNVIFKGISKKMRREFTIHVLHGAKFSDIMTRQLVFYLSMMLTAIILATIFVFPIGLEEPLIIFSVLITSGLILTLSISYIYISLKKENLFQNLRGDNI